jgi:hypothetical protein
MPTPQMRDIVPAPQARIIESVTGCRNACQYRIAETLPPVWIVHLRY